MKKLIFLLLLLLCACVYGVDYITISYENLYYHGDSPDTETITMTFDDAGYLASYKSIKWYGTKKWAEKIIIGKRSANTYKLDFDVKNVQYMDPPNFNYQLAFEKTSDGWKEYKDGEFIAELKTISSQLRTIYKHWAGGKTECLYKQNAATVSLYGDEFELINGFYAKKNLDSEAYERISFNKIDDTHFTIKYNYDALSYIYRIETNYHCRNDDLIELLHELKGFYVNEIILPFIILKDDSRYCSSSFLSEGKRLYKPEHLQYKDGLPWASGNGNGIGDVISIREFEKENPDELRIMNGYQDKAHPDYYEKNSRIKTLKVTNAETGKSMSVTVKDEREPQSFQLGELGAGNAFNIEVVDVYPGNKYDDLCIQYLVIE